MLTPETQPTKERIEFWRDFFHHFLKAERHAEIDALCDMALAHLEAAPNGGLREQLEALIAESEGVAGLHLNGDVATWDWLMENEWLSALTTPAASTPPEGKVERLEAAKQGEDGFKACAEHGPWHIEDGVCPGCAQPPASQGGAALERYEMALREISLMGMTYPLGGDDEDEKRFQARQAWNAIAIAARALSPSVNKGE